MPNDDESERLRGIVEDVYVEALQLPEALMFDSETMPVPSLRVVADMARESVERIYSLTLPDGMAMRNREYLESCREARED